MKALRKIMCLVLCFALSSYTLPLFAATASQAESLARVELTDQEMQKIIGGTGSVDATMSEYIRYDPKVAPVAQAVISNRSNISLPYVLEIMTINGVSLEVLASGTLAAGETKIISGSGSPGVNKGSVRVKLVEMLA
ncbi:hypothetical protein MNBD_GAMMA22-2473 [hydrothermal vent metagenome]|uniref:Uncharacterized protein n=1 Tax=hydrothermal vent metagenome TaxID=652676 RepID=A0A3B0ZXN3_9ZZZZ